MAFTGSATVLQVSDGLVRITGLSLAAAAAGTISLSGGTGAVKCPHAFKPGEYSYEGHDVGLQDSIDVTAKNAATGVATAIPLSIVKTGTTPADFLITITNTHGSLTCENQEFYVRFH